jgi:hypothetical protein
VIPQVERMLRDLKVVSYMGPESPLDPLESRYVTIFNGNCKSEGAIGKMALSEEDAIASYCEGLQKWLDGRTVIIWRHLPELISRDEVYALNRKQTYWAVYSRLTAHKADEFHLLEQS